jgi:hypothetical protein
MNLSRTGWTITLLVCGAAAIALPKFTKDFTTIYGVKPGTALAKAGCAVCHVGNGPKLNAYGLDIQKVMKEGKTKALTADVLKKVENIDSNKDGTKNIDHIKAGTLPGAPKKG